MPPANDALAARVRCGLVQDRFAAVLGISVKTLQNWEQGRFHPTGPAKALLRIIIKHPQVIRDLPPQD